MLDLDPKRAPDITEAIIAFINDLALRGPTEEELSRAKAQISPEAHAITANDIKLLAHHIVRRDLASYALAIPLVTE